MALKESDGLCKSCLAAPLAGRFCAQFANSNAPTKRPASEAAKQLYDRANIFNALSCLADAFCGVLPNDFLCAFAILTRVVQRWSTEKRVGRPERVASPAEWPLTPTLTPEYRGEGVRLFIHVARWSACCRCSDSPRNAKPPVSASPAACCGQQLSKSCAAASSRRVGLRASEPDAP